MKITVIGTLNKDLVFPYADKPFQSLGGITYTLVTLNNFLTEDDLVYPVSYYGVDIADLIAALKKRWTQIHFDSLIPYSGKNHQVILEYFSPTDRKEKALFFFPPLTFTQIEPYLDSDLILVNMICGKELELDTYKKIAEKVYQKLYIDLHFLLMDVDHIGNRIVKRPDNIFDWLNYSRFIQLNENEYEILNQEGLAFETFWKGLLRPSQHVFLTRGENGVWWIRNDDTLKIEKFKAYPIPEIKETTGAGDVFGAAFAYSYLKTKNLKRAVSFGVLAASASTQISGTENFFLLKEKMRELDENLLMKVAK
jgi:hypothetical protein